MLYPTLGEDLCITKAITQSVWYIVQSRYKSSSYSQESYYLIVYASYKLCKRKDIINHDYVTCCLKWFCACWYVFENDSRQS